MTDQTITINLPQSVYERLKRAAEQVALSPEDVLAQSISLALPALESDLPAETQADLASLFLLSDIQLRFLLNQPVFRSSVTT